MKALIHKIAAYLHEYLTALGKLLSGPKTFLATIEPGTEQGFRNGLQFLAVSVVLFVIALSLLSAEGTWKRVAALSVTELLAVAAHAGVIRLAWRLVGGKADTRSIVTVYCYTSAVIILVVATTDLISVGTLRVFAPDLYAATVEGQRLGNPIPSSETLGRRAVIASSLIFAGGNVAAAAWGIAGWGAFRAINNASRGRSVGAFLLGGLMSWPLAFVVSVVGRAFPS